MIPDSMRQRLQMQAAGEHPDADLLTAFAEHALAGKEREGVLLHLAACATCREIVALSLPDSSNVEVVAPASQPWFRWPVLRWTAVAATVIVVGAAVSVLVPRDHPAEVAAPTQQAPATAEKQTEPVTSGLTADKVSSQPVEAKKPVTRNE